MIILLFSYYYTNTITTTTTTTSTTTITITFTITGGGGKKGGGRRRRGGGGGGSCLGLNKKGGGGFLFGPKEEGGGGGSCLGLNKKGGGGFLFGLKEEEGGGFLFGPKQERGGGGGVLVRGRRRTPPTPLSALSETRTRDSYTDPCFPSRLTITRQTEARSRMKAKATAFKILASSAFGKFLSLRFRAWGSGLIMNEEAADAVNWRKPTLLCHLVHPPSPRHLS